MKYKIICADGKLHLNFKSIKEIAEFFEVAEKAVTSWIKGKRKPGKKYFINQIKVENIIILDLGGYVNESRSDSLHEASAS